MKRTRKKQTRVMVGFRLPVPLVDKLKSEAEKTRRNQTTIVEMALENMFGEVKP
jgi:predicted DNA-binding protein